MKNPSFIIVFSCLVSCLHSCDSSYVGSHATGIPYEIVVVMEDAAWKTPAGLAVKEELTSPLPYLLQAESSMRVTYCMPSQFNGLMKYVRNILIVSIDNTKYTKVSLHKANDKWASEQSVLYLNAPDAGSLEAYLAENPRVLVNYYTKEEMRRTAKVLSKNHSPVVMEKVKDKFGISIFAPEEMVSFKDSADCLWFSNNAAIGRTDLLVYTFPYKDDSTFTLNYLVAKRDSFVKYMIPGSFPGTYMSTEKRVVDYSAITLRGKYCGVLRGLWRMEGGDMMGGPFVSYARVDEPNKRVVVTEGFVYEPQREKKNYIRRIEAALKTVRFPDEMDGPDDPDGGDGAEIDK